MKRFFTIFASLLLFNAFVGMTSAGAVDFGKLGGIVKDSLQTGDASTVVGSVGGKGLTLQQVQSDPDYVSVDRNYFYKKSTLNVLSKSPMDWKVKVTVLDFIESDRFMETDYLLECDNRGSPKDKSRCDMFETFLEGRSYQNGKLVSTLTKGPRQPIVKSMSLGEMAGRLYKQATGKEPPKYYQ